MSDDRYSTGPVHEISAERAMESLVRGLPSLSFWNSNEHLDLISMFTPRQLPAR